MRHVWSITVVLLILSIISLFNILSLSILPDGTIEFSDLFTKQLLFILIGWSIYIFLSKLDYSIFKYLQLNILLYVLTLASLVATLIWGPLINNTQRWLIFGEFQFQPSELAKVILVLLTASLFNMRKRLGDWTVFLISFAFLIPIVGIVYSQPHGSMSLILILLWGILVFTIMPNQLKNLILVLILLVSSSLVLAISFKFYPYILLLAIFLVVIMTFTYYARENLRKISIIFLLVGLVLGLVSSITWNNVLLDYQKERVTAFFNPTETSQDLGFNVDQSRIAIGSGRIFGKGWGFGTQSKLDFLPEHKTDFVFAAFSEEFGFIGSLGLILLYSFLIFRILVYSLSYTKLNFEFVFLVGISIKIFLEIFINIGTNTGVIPATGIPLPIISYGGSNILFTFFSLGLVQSIIGHTIGDIKEERLHHVDNKELLD